MALEADGPSRSTTSGRAVPGSTPLHREGVRSGVALIRRPGRPWGVLGVHSTRPAAFDAEATAYVDQVAEVISSAVQRAEAEEQAREQTLYDRLTGLPGRELLLRRLDDAQAEARAHDRRLGLLLIDLDDLRLVNEGYGHEAGDEVLRVVARRVHDLAADGVAGAGHLAGDELVLFWETATDEQVFAAAEDVLAAVREPIVIADERLVMTASIGVAIAGAEERSPEVLLREADVALARAKQQGRARFEVYDDLAHRARSSACACRSTCASPSSRTSCTSSTSRSSASATAASAASRRSCAGSTSRAAPSPPPTSSPSPRPAA